MSINEKRFITSLRNFKEHFRMCDTYISSLESISFNYMGMAYSDLINIQMLYYSDGRPNTLIEALFEAFDAYKDEAEFIVTCNGRKDYWELKKLRIKLLKIIDAIEEDSEKELEKVIEMDMKRNLGL